MKHDPKRLTPDDIARFFDAADRRREPFKPEPDSMSDPLWCEVAEFLNLLEKQHPWKVRRCRSALRWMFRQAHLVHTGAKKL